MRTILTTAGVVALATATAACHPAQFGHGENRHDRPVMVNARLDCPASQGDLNRVEQSADGKTCRYTGPNGSEVVLSYLTLDGRAPDAALAPIEADFRTAVPGALANDASTVADADGDKPQWSTKDDNAGATNTTTTTTASRDDSDDGDDADGGDDNGRHHRHHDNDHVHLFLPGLSINADNGHARIVAFGQTIDADDSKGGRAVIHGGWNGMESTINAHDQGAEMRFGWIGKRSVDMTYIVAGKAPGPTGQRFAAYVAKGPTAGPLVLAVEKAPKHDREDGDDDHSGVHDLKRLVERNVHRS